jgi:hypothetical protein
MVVPWAAEKATDNSNAGQPLGWHQTLIRYNRGFVDACRSLQVDVLEPATTAQNPFLIE